jgi:hypothetical protein
MLLSDLDMILLSIMDQIISTTARFPLMYYSVLMLFPVTEIFLWFPWKRKTNLKGYKRCLSLTPDTKTSVENVQCIGYFYDSKT